MARGDWDDRLADTAIPFWSKEGALTRVDLGLNSKIHSPGAFPNAFGNALFQVSCFDRRANREGGSGEIQGNVTP